METERVTEHQQSATTGTAGPPLPPVGATTDGPATASVGIPAANGGSGHGPARAEASRGRAGGGTGRAVPEQQSQPPTVETGAVSHPSTDGITAAGLPSPARADAPADPAPPRGAAPGTGPATPDSDAPDSKAPDSDAAERERRGGDRLRFVGAATRRIARGMDLDETVLGLCRASVPAYSDAILVYLRDPLPVGDERPTGPVVLRLRRSDRIPDDPHAMVAAQSTAGGARRPRPGGADQP
ncbi:MAG: SpoIIE family protein phosphatase, partial [Streptomyces sp.]